MTQIHEIEEECSVCGENSEQLVLISTNSWGYPDLDLRPPEMQRSTMNVWIQECPHCGYVAGKLTDELQIPKEFLKSDEYNSCDGFDSMYVTKAKSFYRSRCFDELLMTIFSSSDSPVDIFKKWFRANNDVLGQEAFAWECGNSLFIESLDV